MFTKNSQGPYQLDMFSAAGVAHGFSTRSFGNMSFKWGKKLEVEKSRNNFAKALSIRLDKTVFLDLVHGTNVVRVNSTGTLEEADGAVTNVPDLALGILTADCIPIMFYDPKKRAIGVAHSGWIGTVGKIALKVVGKMVAEFGSRPEDILVGLGPAIGKCCYTDNENPIQSRLPEWHNYIEEMPDGKFAIDLNGFTKNELLAVGIRKKNITDSGFCTMDHKDEFFCSQLETAGIEKPARFASIILLI